MAEDLLRDAPTWAPNAAELADLELLLSGAYAPLTGFLSSADVESLASTGRLTDGTSWPVPVTLTVSASVADSVASAGSALILTDPEGAPLAILDVTERTPVANDRVRLAGPVRAFGDGRHGSYQRLRARPADVRAMLPEGRVLAVIADRPLHRPQLAQIAHSARAIHAHVLVLIPVGGANQDGLPPEHLIRTILAAADRLPPATLVAVPIADHGDEIRDALLRARVAANYGATHVLATSEMMTSGGGPRVLVPRDLAYDTRDGQWRASDDIPPRFRRLAMTAAEIDELLDDGSQLPEWHTPPSVARELAKARPPRRNRGLVLFFTGLSGSGKSTIARGVADALLESGERTVTFLDGDVVRRELSAGLTFSKADRDTNIRRIGWVAAEVARHGGVAICCPIAPYEAARQRARAQAAATGGGFVLVHISTPLEVCEQRDRKGLYAKARAGLLTGMTGIDDPYEEPLDADLTIDTSEMSADDAVELVLEKLALDGWLDPR
jgi:sulfate adenylyltransferase